MLLSEGHMSDFKGAALMSGAIPKAKALLVSKGYDVDWFRAGLADRNITACIATMSLRWRNACVMLRVARARQCALHATLVSGRDHSLACGSTGLALSLGSVLARRGRKGRLKVRGPK